jgi:hypothetical protein
LTDSSGLTHTTGALITAETGVSADDRPCRMTLRA